MERRLSPFTDLKGEVGNIFYSFIHSFIHSLATEYVKVIQKSRYLVVINLGTVYFLFHFKYSNSFCYMRNTWDKGDPP